MSAELLRFAVVGGVGFLVDAAVLQALVSLAGWSPFAARAVSFPVALACTFTINRFWTFKGLRMGLARAYGAYGATLGIGAAVSLLFNFYATRRVVFRT